MNKFTSNKEQLLVISILLLFFVAAVILIFNTENSFGGGDHYSHFKLAYWGWIYPKLLFNHWGKPVFTLLVSPFAQLGMNAARMFNLLTGLLTAFLTWKLTRQLKFKNSWLVIFFVLLVPVYFSLMFSVMTEVLHSMFLVLAVLLFFRKDYIWSAVAVSFLPMVRTESIVLLPLFILAFGLKKQWKVFPLLLTGFLLISLAGWHFYDGFWWLVTEMPYKGSAAGIYGHGTLFHFINHTKGILGYPIAGLFYLGLAASVWLWFSKDKLKLNDRFYFLLLIPGVYLTFLAAHSFVWWKGLGNSLGLIRVMGSVSPMVAVTALVGYNYIAELLTKYKVVLIGFTLLVFIWIFSMIYSICPNGFKQSKTQEVIAKATDYILENHLENNKVYFFNSYVPYRLNIDPYNENKASWGVPNTPVVSYSIPDSSLIVWDAHFGPNEGRVPLKKLLNDDGLEVMAVFKPEHPFTVLGGYNYEVYIFRKKALQQREGLNIKMDFEGENPEYTEKRAFSGKKSFHVGGSKVFLNLFEGKTVNVCKDSSLLSISGEIFFEDMENTKDVVIVVSREGEHNSYFYRTFGFNQIASPGTWKHFDFSLKLSPSSGSDEVLKVYFWNKQRKEFWIDDIKLVVSKE
jgi:hypothetical protein